MQLRELTNQIPRLIYQAATVTLQHLLQNWKLGGQKHQETRGTGTHIGPSFCGGFDDAEQFGGGDRASGGGGHLGVPGGRGRLLRRYRHDGARLAGPGAERAEAERPRRRRVLGGILGEESRGGGGGGGGGSKKIPCHWCLEKGFDSSMPSLAF